jgi:hypothetical protein
MWSLLEQEEPSPCSNPGQDCEVAVEATAGCAVEQPLHAVEQPLQQDRAPTVEQPISRDAMDGKGQGSAPKRWFLLCLFNPEAKFLVPDGEDIVDYLPYKSGTQNLASGSNMIRIS